MGQATEHGWVIEKGSIAEPEYITLQHAMLDWSQPGQHLAALRFEREEDAEAFAETYLIGVGQTNRDDIRIAQHGWG